MKFVEKAHPAVGTRSLLKRFEEGGRGRRACESKNSRPSSTRTCTSKSAKAGETEEEEPEPVKISSDEAEGGLRRSRQIKERSLSFWGKKNHGARPGRTARASCSGPSQEKMRAG